MNDALNVEFKDGIAIAEISNPTRMNALTPKIFVELAGFWAKFKKDKTARVAILTGDGDRSFSSGHDMKWLAEQIAATKAGKVGRSFDEELAALGVPSGHRRVVVAPGRIEKPVIAAVNGSCLGFGLMLATNCDLRFCSANATFGMVHSKRGFKTILPHLFYQRGVSAAVALDMGMTGEPISADQAARCGLVSRVYDTPEALREGALSAARAIVENPPSVVNSLKRAYSLGLMQLPTSIAAPIWDNLMDGRHSLNNEETQQRVVDWAEGRG